MFDKIIANDLDAILDATEKHLRGISGERLFITGATGFIGKWLLLTLLQANQRFDLNLSITALSRDPKKFLRQHPEFGDQSSLQFHQGDIRSFSFPNGTFSHVVHAATDVGDSVAASDYLNIFDVCVDGTRRVLEFCKQCSATRLLFTSSGAIYGVQPPTLDQMPEDYLGAPNITLLSSAYGEGKRASEWSICAQAATMGVDAKIIRCYALIGPYLQLNGPFAMGNFIRDAIVGRNLEILGDGRPLRSYLYISDLIEWMIKILFEGKPNCPYNVGGEQPYSILELAKEVIRIADPSLKYEIRGIATIGLPSRYVPSTRRARDTLDLKERVPFSVGIEKTVRWYRNAGKYLFNVS